VSHIEDGESSARAITDVFLGRTEPVVPSEREVRLDKNKKNQTEKIKFQIYYRSTAENNPRSLYVFTDNTDRTSGSGEISDESWYAQRYGTGLKYPTQTTAVVRGLDNARPISTQRWYHEGAKGVAGRWTDADFEEFKKVIDQEIQDIMDAWNTGNYDEIIFPLGSYKDGSYGNGIFNGIISAINETRTPILYAYLQDKMMDLNEYLNGEQSAEDNNAEDFKKELLQK
jgi:hypothetical protein